MRRSSRASGSRRAEKQGMFIEHISGTESRWGLSFVFRARPFVYRRASKARRIAVSSFGQTHPKYHISHHLWWDTVPRESIIMRGHLRAPRAHDRRNGGPGVQ